MMKYAITLVFALFTLSLPLSSYAQGSPSSDQPLEISADKTLEWHRNELRYIARGDAVARQGDVMIRAEILTADYRETKSSAFEIYRLGAEQGVIIDSKGSTAAGDRAVYDIDSGQAVLTGNNLRLTTPEQILTARDNIQYNVPDGILTANGSATVLRGGDRIDADRMIAVLAQDNKGQRQLKRLEAYGHVVITTQTEILSGDSGFYDAATNIAEMSGNVKISRGPNILEGERAEVNLETNVSRMFGGSPAQGGRVRGVFYPDSEKKGQPDAAMTPKEPAPEPVTSYPPPPREDSTPAGSLIAP